MAAGHFMVPVFPLRCPNLDHGNWRKCGPDNIIELKLEHAEWLKRHIVTLQKVWQLIRCPVILQLNMNTTCDWKRSVCEWNPDGLPWCQVGWNRGPGSKDVCFYEASFSWTNSPTSRCTCWTWILRALKLPCFLRWWLKPWETMPRWLWPWGLRHSERSCRIALP